MVFFCVNKPATNGMFPYVHTLSRPDALPILLIEAAGENVALTIVQQLGGSRLRIPKRAEGTRLEKLVGTDAARALVDSLADERLEIPLANRFVNARLQDRGMSQEARAATLRVSRASIQSWDAERRSAAEQSV